MDEIAGAFIIVGSLLTIARSTLLDRRQRSWDSHLANVPGLDALPADPSAVAELHAELEGWNDRAARP